MKEFKCSEDSFDAIYECNCFKLLCPKHYFSHQEDCPDHEINRIKMDTNDKSRRILINFVIACKQKYISMQNELISLESIPENIEEYQITLNEFHEWIHQVNSLLLFLNKAKYVEKKSFYTPFEYFLHQPDDKASKFVSDFNFPKNIEEIGKLARVENIFYFNYFKFVDKRYIFGFNYFQYFDNLNLESILLCIIDKLFFCCEYEMGYEAILNWINLLEIVEEKMTIFWGQLAKIFYDYIKNKEIAKLIKQWEKIDLSLLSKDIDYFRFYIFSESLFKGLNQKDLMTHLKEKMKIILQKYDVEVQSVYDLLSSHMDIGDYENTKINYKKFIRLFRKSSDYETLNTVINSCEKLVEIYSGCKNQRKWNRRLKKIVNNIVASIGKTDRLDEALLKFYIAIGDLDKAHKLAWKSIRLYEKNQINGFHHDKSYIYLLLSKIYRNMGDYIKALQALANAKSCCGILPMNYTLSFGIYFGIGLIYLSNGQYKDALENFEYMINCCTDGENLFGIKLLIAHAHYSMKNYDKGLQYFIEIKENLWDIPGMNNRLLFIIYVEIGESYKCEGNTELANCYYCKAYEIINHIGENNWECVYVFLMFKFFYYNKDYDICETILQMISIEIDNFSLEYKIILFIEWYLLCKTQYKIEEADRYWNKLEKLVDIEKISLLPKKKIALDMIASLSIMALVYYKYKYDLFKAVKICKTIESILDPKIQSHMGFLKFIFEILLSIYKQQSKLEEMVEYSQKYLKLLKFAQQNEDFRQIMKYSKDDIEKLIRYIQENNLENLFQIIKSY